MSCCSAVSSFVAKDNFGYILSGVFVVWFTVGLYRSNNGNTWFYFLLKPLFQAVVRCTGTDGIGTILQYGVDEVLGKYARDLDHSIIARYRFEISLSRELDSAIGLNTVN